MKDNISIIIGILGIILAVFLYYQQNRNTKTHSNFYIYVYPDEQKISSYAKKLSLFFIIIILIIYALLSVIRLMGVSYFDDAITKKLLIICVCAEFVFLVTQTIANYILVFKHNKFIDKRIDEKKTRLLDYTGTIEITFLALIIIISVLAFNSNNKLVAWTTCVLFYLTFQGVYLSYLHVYFELRRRFHVKKLSIVTQSIEYENVNSYSINSGRLSFICYDNNIIKKVEIPISEHIRIENVLDLDRTLLDYFSDKKNTDENREKNKNKSAVR